MQAPDNETFWRPRTDVIRELVAAGWKPKAIRARCVELGYEEPSPQAIWRARTFDYKGTGTAERPSYYFLCKTFLEAYRGAVSRGKLIAVTHEMKELIDCMEACVLQDLSGEPLTDRRRKKKRKAKDK